MLDQQLVVAVVVCLQTAVGAAAMAAAAVVATEMIVKMHAVTTMVPRGSLHHHLQV